MLYVMICVVLMFTLFELCVPYSMRDSKVMAVSLTEVERYQQNDKSYCADV